MQNQNIILKILNTKNNTFFTFLDTNYVLLYKQSIGKKITQDYKASLLSILTQGLSKIKEYNSDSSESINLYLYLLNFSKIYIPDLLNLFFLWKINLCYFSFDLNIPHNGCRYPHKSRKRNQQFKQVLREFDLENDFSDFTSSDSEFSS